MQPDILERLRKWSSLKVGDPMPNVWGPALTTDLNDAIAEIERLRALVGAASPEPDLATIRQDLKTAG